MKKQTYLHHVIITITNTLKFVSFWLFVLLATSAFEAVATPKIKPLQVIQDDLLTMFTPVGQDASDEFINHGGDTPFSGDCDDYFSAAFNQMYVHYYEPYAYKVIVKRTGSRHIMACVGTGGQMKCLDNRNKRVVNARQFRRQYKPVKILTF